MVWKNPLSQDLDQFSELFERVRVIIDVQVLSGIAKFESGFNQLRSEIELVHRAAVSAESAHPPSFNIFKLLGVGRDEVRHSKVLANFLNPAGSHGQGKLFLQRLLQQCYQEFGSQGFPEILNEELLAARSA